jgi:hypothetical protein
MLSSAARAEHTIQLRGVMNVEGFKAALLEIDYFPPGNTNAFHRYAGSTRLINEGDKIEDSAFQGTKATIELLKVDSENLQVALRDDGVEKHYSIPLGQGMPSGQMKFALANAPIDNAADIYSIFTGRVILIHPELENRSVGFFSAWPKTPTKAEEARVLEKYFGGQEIATVPQGSTFFLLVPSNRTNLFKSAPANLEPQVEPFVFADMISAMKMYENLTEKTQTERNSVQNSHLYLHTMRPISKSEAIYAIETLFNWNGISIINGPNKTFSIVQKKPPG